eukprot:1159235-Pelagomonas_calceolata.AAC.17
MDLLFELELYFRGFLIEEAAARFIILAHVPFCLAEKCNCPSDQPHQPGCCAVEAACGGTELNGKWHDQTSS